MLGIRGLPPAHGGFETFVGRLAPYLVERGWEVSVFCQVAKGDDRPPPTWRGVKLIPIEAREGSRGSIAFDRAATRAASAMPGAALVFGYNTAVLNFALTTARKPFAVNMDGIEWQRRKWGLAAKAWFYLSERVAVRISPLLIADHPAIANHLARRAPRDKIRMIPYGADEVPPPQAASFTHLFGSTPNRLATIIARPEPENSILEMVQAFSSRPRKARLVVLGKYDRSNAYQRRVLDAATDEVVFPGPIYDRTIVDSLRANSAFYMYGHTVGGTSPTLVEALAAGTTPLCLDTVYARWVAGEAGVYFSSTEECDAAITSLLAESAEQRRARSVASRTRFAADFTWDKILGSYERLLEEISD